MHGFVGIALLPVYTRKNAQDIVTEVCKQVVTNLFTSCRQVVFALLRSYCNKFVTSLMALSDLIQGCSNMSDNTVMI